MIGTFLWHCNSYFGPTHFCVHVSGVISSSEEFSAVSKVFFHHRHVDFSISNFFLIKWKIVVYLKT